MVWYGRRRGGLFGAAVLRQYGSWALILFVLGLLGMHVDNWGHAGGFLGGVLVALMLGSGDQRSERGIHRVLAAACLALTAVAFALQLWTAFAL